jgi:hypothetical protein
MIGTRADRDVATEVNDSPCKFSQAKSSRRFGTCVRHRRSALEILLLGVTGRVDSGH